MFAKGYFCFVRISGVSTTTTKAVSYSENINIYKKKSSTSEYVLAVKKIRYEKINSMSRLICQPHKLYD